VIDWHRLYKWFAWVCSIHMASLWLG